MTAPRVGDVVTVRGLVCRVVAILPAATVEVETVDGSRAFRVSGLGFSASGIPPAPLTVKGGKQ